MSAYTDAALKVVRAARAYVKAKDWFETSQQGEFTAAVEAKAKAMQCLKLAVYDFDNFKPVRVEEAKEP
jgi:hypothetical protein